MTPNEATIQLIAQCPWMSVEDIDTLLDPNMGPTETMTILRVYRSAKIPATGPGSWETVLRILETVGQVAGYILPAVGVISAVYGLAKS
jgi:hypothetical protein